MLPQTKESISHILKHFKLFRQDRKERDLPHQPMIVGVSGCQGSGKTTLCDTLCHLLKEEPYNLNVVSFSLDDVYLTHKDQQKLSEKYKGNPLYQQRGQAGSHDLTLTQSTFASLLKNRDTAIPVYDKSKFQGQGDRLEPSEWKQVQGPYDIILFEGWMLGFKPLVTATKNSFVQTEYAQVMNEHLKAYESEVYPYFDIFIHLSPFHIQQVYEWRLQQEHHMRLTRGVEGLSDEKVKAFVDTYMPAYELYLPRLNKVGFFGQGYSGEPLKPYEGLHRLDGGYSQPNRHLRLVLDKERKVIEFGPIQETSNQVRAPFKQTTLFTTKMMYRCAFVGVLGFIGYHHKFIYNSFLHFSKRFSNKN